MPSVSNRTPSDLFAEIKWLREKTGLNAMSCREALIAANGDRQAAQAILRKKTFERAKQDGMVMDG